MPSQLARSPLAHLVAAVLIAPTLTYAFPPLEAGVPYSQLFERNECAGEMCGWNGQLCCSAGYGCYTDSSNQAQCSSTGGGSGQTAAAGRWEYVTTTYVETDLKTYTSTISSYAGDGGDWATPTAASGTCDFAKNEEPCGDVCCKSSEYCYQKGQCKDAGNGGSSGYYTSYYSTMYETTNSAGVPLRPTSSTLIVVTETGSPSTTLPFETPVATGAEVGGLSSSSEEEGGGGGLSGGAIAGIVIGTLAGLILLGFICFYCCVRGLFNGVLAIFGGGKKRSRRTTEIDEYERYSHHGSGRHSGAGAAGGRTWYGAAARPSRPDRRDSESRTKKVLGVGAALAGLWAVLGLKRRHDRRHDDEKYSEYSYSSDYYTNTSASKFKPFYPPKSLIPANKLSLNRQRELRRQTNKRHQTLATMIYPPGSEFLTPPNFASRISHSVVPCSQ
ncbi:hypothetical protein Q7P37_001138 [Cladosporium fusiforme]